MLIHFMYCRKSSEDEERQIISNQSQNDELTPLVQRDHLRVCDKIEEEASAKTSGTRPRFNDMVRRIKKGEANAILCWHLNRLSRNAGDAAVLIELMDQNRLLEIRTPSQTFKNSPGDKFLITLFCSQAKLENDNKGVDVVRGLRQKAVMGFYPGVAPMGYLNDKTKLRGERDLYNDPERFPLVKKMWQMMLTGTYTPPQILKIANDEWGFRTRKTRKQGGNPMSLSALYHIFHNPFYYGWFEYPSGSGKWYEGKHEAMVTKAEFDHVHGLLGRKGNPRPSKHLTFSFTGIIRCGECSGMITAEEKRQVICTHCHLKFVYPNRELCPRCMTSIAGMSKPLFLHYTYYHCAKRKTNCKQRSVEVAELEKQIVEQLGRIQVSARFKAWAFEYLQEIHLEDMKTERHVSQSRDKAYADCIKRLEGLVKLKTSPENGDSSLLSDEEYSQERQKLLKEKAAFKQSPEDIRRQAEKSLRESEATFEFAHSARAKFIKGDFRLKKQILAEIGSNLTLRDKRLIFEAKKPFVLIENAKSCNDGDSGRIEPENDQAVQGQNDQTTDEFSRVLRDVKEVRTLSHKNKKMIRAIYRHFKSVVEVFGPNVWN